MNLLAAEITARTGRDPGEHYRVLAGEFGAPHYMRIDAAATPEQKAKLGELSPDPVTAFTLAGEPITAKLTKRPMQQRRNRRVKVNRRQRLVRGASIGHREHLQDLRGEYQGRGMAASGRAQREVKQGRGSRYDAGPRSS